MFTGLKTILFATNLTRNCIPAFDVAVILGLKFQAKIVLLHVLEKVPDYVSGRLEGLFGETHWNEIMDTYERDARQTLIGKRSTNKMIQKALEQLCVEAGVDEAACGYDSREVVIGEGDIATTILETSKKHNCDMIIMGGHEGVFSKKSVGNTIKTVLGKAAVPVVVVPVDPKLEAEVPLVSGWRK